MPTCSSSYTKPCLFTGLADRQNPGMSTTLTAISSMATRAVLAELAAAWRQRSGVALAIESVGGVDAARRVVAGEGFDLVFLAADAVDKLMAGGHLRAYSRTDLMVSPVAVAVRQGESAPDISTEQALRQAVLAAPTIGYSTGPSGVALLALFQRWGMDPSIKDRLRQAPAGMPVARLVAQGEVALGFQQLSELLAAPGITVLGPLPEAVQINTVFSGALGLAANPVPAAQDCLAYFCSAEAEAAKRRHGMTPA